MLIPYLPYRCSHISMGVLILLDHQDGHDKFFKPVSILFIPSCLCFPHPPSLFFMELEFSNEISILFMWGFFILFPQCPYPVILRKMLKSFKFIILLFSYSVGGCNSRFRFNLILFPHFTMLSYSGAPIKSFSSCYSYLECWRYLRRFIIPFLIRSNYFEDYHLFFQAI